MTARDLINGALRLIGVVSAGQQPSNDQAQDALISLNSLISTWRTERLMVFAVLPQTFQLVANKKTYSVGPGGDFAIAARPTRIEKVTLQYATAGVPSLTLPLQMLNIDQYAALHVPDTASTIPQFVYDDSAQPLRNLSFYPVPSIANSVSLYIWQQLMQFATLDDVLTVPDGYERALRYGLAVDIAPEYGRDPLATVVQKATDAKAAIAALNDAYVPLLRVDAGLRQDMGGKFDIRTDGGSSAA